MLLSVQCTQNQLDPVGDVLHNTGSSWSTDPMMHHSSLVAMVMTTAVYKEMQLAPEGDYKLSLH